MVLEPSLPRPLPSKLATPKLHHGSVLASFSVPWLCTAPLPGWSQQACADKAVLQLDSLPRSWSAGSLLAFSLTKLEPKEPSSVSLFPSFPSLPDKPVPSICTLSPSFPPSSSPQGFLNSQPGLSHSLQLPSHDHHHCSDTSTRVSNAQISMSFHHPQDKTLLSLF